MNPVIGAINVCRELVYENTAGSDLTQSVDVEPEEHGMHDIAPTDAYVPAGH
jgi:hypothetical protein